MIGIKIRRLIAWSPVFSGLQPSGGLEPAFLVQFEQKYSPQKISSAQSRRLSDLTKISVDLGLRVTEGESVDHVVFSSRHGELFNSVQLLQMIGQKEVLSPTLFSQSVHNTSVGTYSLLKKIHAAATALSSGKNGFIMGLVSAAAYLNENPRAQVLYISSDSVVPVELAIGLREENISFGVAMVVEKIDEGRAGECQIQFSPSSERASVAGISLPQPVEFLQWLFSSQAKHNLLGDRTSWTVQKC